MKVIGFSNKKTNTKFFGNDPYFPTELYLKNRNNEGVELEKLPIVQINFQIEKNNYSQIASGMRIVIKDIETDKVYENSTLWSK